MEERGYNDFWEEKADNNSKSTKTKKIIVGVVFIIIPLIVLGSVFVNIQKRQTEEALNACLAEVNEIYSATTEAGAPEVGRYTSLIECHEKYKTDTYDQSVASINEQKTRSELIVCLGEAETNYAISKEEIESAETINDQLILVKRRGSGIDAKMDCHNKYKTSFYETDMNKLKADKAENKSYIEDIENTIKYRQSNGSNSSKSTYCSSYTIGSSIYTNCY